MKQDTIFHVFLLLELSVGVTKCYNVFLLCGVLTIIIMYMYKYVYTCCSKSLVLLSNIYLRFLWTWAKYLLITSLMRKELFLVCMHCRLKCKVLSPKYFKGGFRMIINIHPFLTGGKGRKWSQLFSHLHNCSCIICNRVLGGKGWVGSQSLISFCPSTGQTCIRTCQEYVKESSFCLQRGLPTCQSKLHWDF